jgi:hypothetical protein
MRPVTTISRRAALKALGGAAAAASARQPRHADG